MAGTFAALERIDNNRSISRASDPEFWYGMELSLLLALRERGVLNMSEYRHAEERLSRQFRNPGPRLPEGGNR